MKTQFTILVAGLMAATAYAQTVTFSQAFNFTAGKNGALTQEGDPGVIGWRGSFGPSGTALPFSFGSGSNANGPYAWSISDGNFIYATNLDGASNPMAWFLHTTDLDVQDGSFNTTGYSTLDFASDVPGQVLTNRTYAEILSVSTELRNPDASDLPSHMALLVDLGNGPEWVVAADAFTGADNSFSTYSIDTDSSAVWLQGVYTPDVFLADGPLLANGILIPDSAPVLGYGIYVEVPNDFVSGGTGRDSSSIRVRMRNYEVTAVIPEPSTYALMGLGLVALFFVLRRRR